ncbi:MAG TPA: chromosome segregation protein SMC [Acidimicrobiia bacterium]|nr:chromosome segregation protein SMC [Acidimicrobiia bacterium]
MYLKSLKLAGFKSFADRARLEFRPGVTVVVGPNGSGKSNLVDALSWVLGTQSNKNLRAGKMEDVIFAGTATRPSLGKAETTLVIDNTERLIDLDLDEVAITRRLYRDGSSDYELNGVGCRLLDIQDLLSDSGVGRHQHVIIGQGEIGRVLNASPEEHRAVIEEAAGILKHRRRKEKAERRLERTDEDMVRLTDLLAGLSRQMRPLRRQSKAAERYEGLKSEVIALRLYLGGQEIAVLDRELTIATSEKSIVMERLETDTKKISEMSQRLSTLSVHTAEVGSELDRDTSAAASLETTNERLRRVASIAVERNRAMSGRREAAVERRVDIEEEALTIEESLGLITMERRAAEGVATKAEAAFRRLEDQERAIATQNSLSPEGALAAARGELSALESSLDRDERELDGLNHRMDVLVSQRTEEVQEIERINAEILEMDSSLQELNDVYRAAERNRSARQEHWSAAEERRGAARIAMAAAEARREAVVSALAGRFDSEARKAIETAPGALGSLASQLDIPSGLEEAVGAALGEWADAIAFDEAGSVQSAVETVKGAGGGSVSVVSSISETATPASEVATQLGLEALVDRLGPRRHPGLASRLLGDVVLVEGWTSGWALVAKHPSLRAVTPEGDVISVAGVRIADPDGEGSVMLEAAEVALEKVATDLARAESIHTAAKRDFEKAREIERAALERLEQAESAVAGHSEAMKRLEAAVRGIEDEQARLEDRRSAIDEALLAGRSQKDVLRARLEALEGEEAERLAAWEEMEARRVELAAQRENARSDWQEATAALRAVVERQTLLEHRKSQVDDELGRLDLGVVSEADPARLAAVGDYARRGVTTLERRISELRGRQAGLREVNDEVKNQLETLRGEHQARTEAISESRARVGELDVRLTELRMRREAVIEAIRRDADSDLEAAMVAPRPDVAEDLDLSEMLENGLTQLRRLGPINPLAAEEYRELEERHTFLSDQMADVETSRSELRKVIAALENEIQVRFDQAFTEVAAAYERYFEVLFPGGRGRIRLVDEEDGQSGVVIDAQPLGKKVSAMTLLSGGERSLAALAFLFAIFEARPSPFYVLDEVEAALDDTNLRRFLRVVDEFRGRAQLIIVTHQQQTMEVADVLYGVTMEPGGSSRALRKEMRASVGVDGVARDQLA